MLLATVLENPYIPQKYKDGLTPKQAEFLADESREILYGGAAGGGKSVALLMAAAQYVTEPGYSAVILRRTFAQMSKSDSILELAKEWWLGDDRVKFNGDEYKFTFPRGATVQFGHMENERSKFNYQGGAFRFVGYDELTQFTETQYTYLFSRQRKAADSPHPLRMRATSNPGGVGHQWVYKRFIDTKTRRPRAKFIPAKLKDNPNVDEASYREGLAELDPLTRLQLEEGRWDAVAGGRFKMEWFGNYRPDPDSPDFMQLWHGDGCVERFKPATCARFQTCDPAASTSDAANHFVLSTWLVTPKANLLWWGCEFGKMELPDQVLLCQSSYRRHGPKFVAVEVLLNQRGLRDILRRSKDPVMVVREMSPRGHNKLERAAGFINLAASGRVFLPEDGRPFPHDEVTSELTRFTGEDGGDDDFTDTGSYAAEILPELHSGGGAGRPIVKRLGGLR